MSNRAHKVADARPQPDDEDTGRRSISEAAYQHLRSRIFAGELPPNTLLTERRLADALGASRTPLRAAISRLEGEGLIGRTAGGGFVVRHVSIDELLEILSIRRMLEGEAAALAAERIARGALDIQLAATQEIAACPEVDVETFWRYDDAFHRTVAEASGRTLLLRIIEDLRGRARMCHLKTMDRHFGPQAEEHLRVLHAIARGDADASRQAMEAHGDRVRDRLLAWLARR